MAHFRPARRPFDTGPKTPHSGLPEDPKGPVIRGSSRNIARRFPRILEFLGSPSRSQGNSARSSGQVVPAEAFLPCRFPMSPPVLESQPRLFHASLRVGRQAGKPAPGPVSTAIVTKDNLRQYVAPLYTQEPSITHFLNRRAFSFSQNSIN